MPRNGSGSYSLPAGNPFVPTTVISSTVVNNDFSDIATELTNSIAADGQTPITAHIPWNNKRITGLASAVDPTDAATLAQATAPAQTIRNELLSSVSSMGVGMMVYVPSTAYSVANSLGKFLNFTYAITAAEVTAGVTPSNYAYLPGDPLRYGAAGDWNGSTGTADDTAFNSLISVINSQVGGAIYLRNRRYRLTLASSLTAFASCRGITIYSDGAEIVVDRTFTGSQQPQVWTFTACNNTAFVGGIKGTCTQSQNSGEHTSRGPQWCNLTQGCIGFKAQVTELTDFREGYHAIRAQTDPISYASRNLDFGLIKTYRTGYPLAGSLSGYNVTGTVHSEEAGRSYFWTGGVNHQIVVRSKNHQASVDCLIASDPCNDSGSALGAGMNGLELWYTNQESTGADNSLNCIDIQTQNSDTMVSSHRNIKIHLNISNSAAGNYLGFGFSMSKVTASGSGDTNDRGHIYENIYVDGVILGASGNQRSVQTQRLGTWGTSLDRFSTFQFSNLKLDTVGQPNWVLTALRDVCLFENLLTSGSPAVTGSATAGTKVVFRNYNFGGNDPTVGGGLVYFVDPTSKTVTYSASMTIDACTGTNFVIGPTNSTAFTINAPTNPSKDMIMSVIIRNGTGGALGAATWNAVFKMDTWTQPANNKSRSITFLYNGTNWIEQTRNTTDIPV